MNEEHYGWIINTHYEWLNMLTKMEQNNPRRFNEFNYSKSSFYHYLDKLQHEQNLYD
jgi:23S rRNA maturation-related 3'-5' exoribonuclease YhaM